MRVWMLRGMLGLACLGLVGCKAMLPEHLPWEKAQPPGPGIDTAAGLRVGVVLPISGENATLGRAMLNGAILANYDMHNRNVSLVPLDQAAVLANPNILLQENLGMVVGPLTADATRRVQPVASQNRIRVFSLSNDASLRDDNTVVFGYRVEAELARVLSYAASHGRNQITAIVPDDAYGNAVAAALHKIDPSSNRGAGTDVPEMSDQSFLANLKNFFTFTGRKTDKPKPEIFIARFHAPADLVNALKDAPATNAILLPLSGDRLNGVLQQLASPALAHIRGQYLGTGLWDDDAARKTPALSNAWYPAADPAAYARYVARYQKQYARMPVRLSALTYNAVAMVSQLEKQSSTKTIENSQIFSSSGFSGVDGLFRIFPDGSVERSLAVVKIQNSESVMIDPAPSSFNLSP